MKFQKKYKIEAPYVETEANEDLWSKNGRSLSLVGSLAHRAGTRHVYPALDSLVQNIFFLTAHFFNKGAGQYTWSLSGRQVCAESSLVLTEA